MNYSSKSTFLGISVLFLNISLFTSSTSYAQRWYKHSMVDNILAIDSSTSYESSYNSSQVFKRVYSIKKDDWHALYHLIFSKAKAHSFYKQQMLSKKYKRKDEISIKKTLQQNFLNDINPLLTAIDSLKADTVELKLLKAFIHLQLTNDKYDEVNISKVKKLLNESKIIAPQNPRVDIIEMLLINYISPMEVEKIQLLKSVANLKINSFSNNNPYFPSWGYYYIQ